MIEIVSVNKCPDCGNEYTNCVCRTTDYEKLEDEIEFLRTKLSERDARIVELEASLEAGSKIIKDAVNIFAGNLSLCDDADSEEWIWKWQAKYFLHETDIPVHDLPNDMKEDEK